MTSYSCPRTCRRCGNNYTVFGNGQEARQHRTGICKQCTRPRPSALDNLTRTPAPRLPGARCAGQDPELWQSDDPDTIARAKNECAQCPALEACRAWALTHHDIGIWGGMTERERDRTNAARKRTA